MTAKRLFCIHPDCLGPGGLFDINYLENSFNSGCIAKGYFNHVMERHATPENCVSIWFLALGLGLQGGPYLLGHFPSHQDKKSGPKDMGHPVGPNIV